MRLMASILFSSALLACSDASPLPASSAGEGGAGGDGAGGEGGGGGVTTSGTTSPGTGGGDGAGGDGTGGDGGSAPEAIVLTISTPEDCARQGREMGAVGPGPAATDVIALGRFEAPEPMLVEEFQYWSCAGVPHEVVFFSSASAEPDEDATLRTLRVPGLLNNVTHKVALPIDPPLVLDAEHRYGYFGVRMTRDATGATMCVVTCRDSAQPESNYWSDHAEAPFGWKLLSQSPTPESGLDEDYMFSVAGRRQ